MRSWLLWLFLVALSASPPARAQGLSTQLSALLTEQVPTSSLIPDVTAASTTSDTVTRLFSIELSNVPIASSSGGFVYRLNPSLGLFERASDSFGPFFTERILRNGRGQLAVGLSFQYANFSSMQGTDLAAGAFVTNAARVAGGSQPFSVDALALELDTRTTTVFSSYGVSDQWSVGVAVPVTRVRFSGTRIRHENGISTLQSRQAGSSTGLGDVTANTRYLVAGSAGSGVSIGSDVRLPTGREDDLLGSGSAALRVLGVASYEDGRLSANVNGGVGVGGASRELFWSMATTFVPTGRVTVVAELLGRRLTALHALDDVYQSHPLMPGVETMRWLTGERGVTTALLVTGAKWNVTGRVLLNANLLFSVSDGGLRSPVTPALSFDYHFDR